MISVENQKKKKNNDLESSVNLLKSVSTVMSNKNK